MTQRNENTDLDTQIREIVRDELARLPTRDPDALVSVADAARILGLSEGSVRARTLRGTLPARRIGRTLRYRVGDLLRLG